MSGEGAAATSDRVLLIDIEVIGDELFSVGCAFGCLVAARVGIGFTICERKRFVMPCDFPARGDKGHGFWERNRTVYDTLIQEAVDPQETAHAIDAWLQGIGAKYPGTIYAAANTSFDLGVLSEFLRYYGREAMEQFRVGDDTTVYRETLDTRSWAKGVLAATGRHVVPVHGIWQCVYQALGLCLDQDGVAQPCMVNKFAHTHIPDEDAAEELCHYMYVKKKLLERARE